MAIRHKTAIRASAYRSRLLSVFTDYLVQLIEELSLKKFEAAELVEIEKNLETLEMALVHLWISVPYNQALAIPRILSEEQLLRLKTIAKPLPRANHLRLAHSRAA